MSLPLNKVRSIGTIEQHEHEDSASARRVLPVDEQGNPINADNPLPVDVTISGESKPDNPTIFRVAVALANTEYSQLLPDKTAKFEIRVVELAKLQFAFKINESGTNYFTIRPGTTYFNDDLNLVGKSVYFQANKANVTVEILTWSY